MLLGYVRAHLTQSVGAIVIAGATANALAQQAPSPAPQPPITRQGQPAGFPRLAPLPFPDAPQMVETLGGAVRVVPVAKGLTTPWSLAFLPNGDILVTEKPGRLRIVRNGTLDEKPIQGVPTVWTEGQGGLLEVMLHPQYSENKQIYLTYAKPGERGAATALARGRFDGTALSEVRDLFVAENWGTGRPHFGSKLAFGPDGFLYMSTGERGERDRAQDLAVHNGKILRLKEDGSPAPGNAFAGRDDAKPEIYSYGHRNVQGLAFDASGVLWAHEHGPQGGDELNRIEPGRNYGWPIATYGREYTGEIISKSPSREGIEEPVIFWAPSIGLSGLAIYTGDRFPAWKGNFFLGALSGQQVQRVVFNERGIFGRESLLGGLRLRVRDVRQGPDGLIYLAADGSNNSGGLLRLEPTAATTSAR